MAESRIQSLRLLRVLLAYWAIVEAVLDLACQIGILSRALIQLWKLIHASVCGFLRLELSEVEATSRQN